MQLAIVCSESSSRSLISGDYLFGQRHYCKGKGGSQRVGQRQGILARRPEVADLSQPLELDTA
jgi:hypothetical protein